MNPDGPSSPEDSVSITNSQEDYSNIVIKVMRSTRSEKINSVDKLDYGTHYWQVSCFPLKRLSSESCGQNHSTCEHPQIVPKVPYLAGTALVSTPKSTSLFSTKDCF